jgi:membrane protein
VESIHRVDHGADVVLERGLRVHARQVGSDRVVAERLANAVAGRRPCIRGAAFPVLVICGGNAHGDGARRGTERRVSADVSTKALPEDRRDRAARGRDADVPVQIPARGWKDVLVRAKAETKADNVSLLAAGVAFFSLLAIVPALVALVSIYGLVADPEDVANQISDALRAAPAEARDLVQTQLESITGGKSSSVGLGALIGIVVALWSASSGMQNLIAAINLAYDEDETRGFVRLRAVSLALTVGAVLFVVVAIALVALLPALLGGTELGAPLRVALNVLRWPLLAAALLVGLAVVYRYAPDREPARWSWVSPGAVIATVLWIVGSLLFSLYTANFAKYNETYGSLGAVVVLMLWLYLTAFVVMLGAEINAELERQTRADTTTGQDRPLGARGAYAADTLGETAEEVRDHHS